MSVLRTCHVFLKLGMHECKGRGGTTQGVWGNRARGMGNRSAKRAFQ